MTKQPDFSVLAKMLIDDDAYWEGEGIDSPTSKQKEAMKQNWPTQEPRP